MLKLEWDGKSERITLGKREWIIYQPYQKSVEWVYDVLRANNIRISGAAHDDPQNDGVDIWSLGYVQPPKLSRKDWAKTVGDVFGCSYGVLFKHFKALQFKVFIGDDFPIVKKISPWNHRKGWDTNSVSKLQRSREKLRQAKADGLDNLLPFIAQYDKAPQDMRQEFKDAGRLADWKTICRNSATKNLLLVKGSSTLAEAFRSEMSFDAPSTLVKVVGVPTRNKAKYMQQFKGKWHEKETMVREYRLAADTKTMAERLQQPFSYSWTARRMYEEHDRLAKLENARKFSPETI